jgi:serine/threonine-protein kinase
MADLAGRTLLSKYRIERLLGQGGMGSVWQGVHVLTGRKIAIKVLDERFLSNLNVVQRFGREARAASAIRHDGIVEVLDLDQTEEGVPFLVMEFLEGELLSRRIDRRGKLGQDELVKIGTLLLDALVAAHQAGVVHRDLKPDNIFLVPAGRRGEIVKILDFGISSKHDEAQAKLTVTGSVLGTPHYMSPEQALGEAELDQRVDVYGAGVVLYECCVGDVPFDAANYNKLLRVILDDDAVPPRRRGADISEALEHVIMKAMSKSREKRFTTARELLDAWKAAASGASVVRMVGGASGTDDSVVARWEASSLNPIGGAGTASPRSHTPAEKRVPSDRPPPDRGSPLRTSAVVPRALGGLDDYDGGPGSGTLEFDEAAMPSARSSHHKLQSPYAQSPHAKRATPTSEPPPPPIASSPGTVPAASAPATSTGRHVVSASLPPPAPAEAPAPVVEPPWWRAWVIRGAVALVIFCGLVFGLRRLVRGGDEDRVETDSLATTVPATTTAEPTGSEWVLIDIEGLPPDAHVRLDGLPGATLPLRVRRGSHHVVDLTCPGYVDRHLEITGTSSQRIRADMRPDLGTTQQEH